MNPNNNKISQRSTGNLNNIQMENQQIKYYQDYQINNINPNFVNNYALNISKMNQLKNNNGSNDDIKEEENSEDIYKKIRIGFIRKVYVVLLFQLSFTFGVCCLSFLEKIRDFVSSHPIIYLIIAIISFIIVIILSCCIKIARKVPINYLLLFIWTFCESYLLLTVCSFYNYEIVLTAIGLTVGITIGLTIYACYTKTDFTMCGGILFCLLIGLLFFGIFGFLFGEWVYTLYCYLGVLLFSFYLIMDTQLILKKFGNGFDIDDYIIATLSLYIDIINIFLFVLRILGFNCMK